MNDTLHTYQDLSRRFAVSVKTIYRWFRGRPGKFAPTKGTIRIPESAVALFIAEKTQSTNATQTPSNSPIRTAASATRTKARTPTP